MTLWISSCAEFCAQFGLGWAGSEMAVRLIGIPPDLSIKRNVQTRKLFEKCLGQTFVIVGLEHVEGLPYLLARLDGGLAIAEEPWKQTIWVEPEYLRVEN